MSGIFNLFCETSESNRGHLAKPVVRSKSALALNGPVGKAVTSTKPKGLSIRSNSDLNITNFRQDTSGNKQQFLKAKVTQLDSTGRPISPNKELTAKKLNSKKSKDPSPQKDNPNVKLLKNEKLSDDLIFKKPSLPKKIMKKPALPEPESLAPYWNAQNEFENIYMGQWDFESLIKKDCVKPFEDEGFESDPELLPCSILPKLSASSVHSDEEWQTGWSPKLPDISDDEV